MNRSRRAPVFAASGRPGLVGVLVVVAVVTLVLGLVVQGYAWANPASPPAAGPVSPGELTRAGVARALAAVLLTMVLPMQVIALALVVAIRPFFGRSQPSRRRGVWWCSRPVRKKRVGW